MKGWHLHGTWPLALLITCAAPASSASANLFDGSRAPKYGLVTVKPRSLELVGYAKADGTLEGGTGYLRLELSKAAGNTITHVTLLASDFRVRAGGERQSTHRGHMSLSARRLSLEPGVPEDVAIKITGITVPGKYHSTVRIVAPGPGERSIPVDLTVIRVPDLKPVPDKLTANLSNCRWEIVGCGVSSMVLPPGARQDKVWVWVDAQVGAPLEVRAIEAAVRGEHSGREIPEKDFQITHEPSGHGGLGRLTVSIDRHHVAPDHYMGSVFLTLAGEPQRRAIPVDINVRHGAGVPLFILIVTVPIGWLVLLFTTVGRKRRNVLRRLRRVQRELATARPGDADAKLIAEQAAEVRARLDTGDLDRTLTEADQLLPRLRALREARLIEKRSGNKPDIKAKAEAVRVKVAERAAEADVEKALRELRAAEVTAPSRPVAADARLAADARPVSGLLSRVMPAVLELADPVIGSTVMVLLVLLGLKEAYLDNPTFGAQPLKDYLTLVLWGLAAWATKRATTRLGGPS